MKKFFLTLLTIFFAYFCAFFTSGASEKQDLFSVGGSLSMYKFFCALTGETDTTDANDVYSRGERYLYESEYTLSIQDMKKVLMLDSSYSMARYTMAKAFLGLGDTSTSILNFKSFIKINGEYADAYLELGNIYENRGFIDSGFYYYKKALDINNSYPVANYHMAMHYYNSDIQDSALQFINWALEDDNYIIDYRNLRRLIYIKQNRQDLADQEYQFIASNNPDYFGDYKEKAKEANKEGNYQASIEFYKLALVDQPTDRELLEARAWAYHSLSKYDSALIDFERVLNLYPDYLSYFNMAYTLDVMDKVEDAIIYYDKSVDYKSDYYLTYNNRGYEFYRLKQYASAEADYSKSIELKGDYYLNYYNRGILYSEMKEYNRAIEDYKNALLYADSKAAIIYSMALAYDKLNNRDEAIYNYNEFLKQASESDSIRINYATERVAELSL